MWEAIALTTALHLLLTLRMLLFPVSFGCPWKGFWLSNLILFYLCSFVCTNLPTLSLLVKLTSHCNSQCDQIAILFFTIWPFREMKICQKLLNICQSLLFCQILDMAKSLLKFCLSGEFSPNLVTLTVSRKSSFICNAQNGFGAKMKKICLQIVSSNLR